MSAETDIQFEVWQDGHMVATADSLSDAEHFMVIYGQDGPVEAKTAITVRTPGFTVRTPAPEGEVSLWGCADGNGIDPRLVFRDRPTAEQVAADMNMVVQPLYASPVVPVGRETTLPPISLDGPHKIGEHRQWLAQQLLDSRQDDAEAYSTVIYSPAMTDIWRDDVVPVGVSRETLRKAVRPVLDRHPMIDSSQSHKLDIQAGWVADAIIAALRPADTGREG